MTSTPRQPYNRPPAGNLKPILAGGPQFNEPALASGTAQFIVRHGSNAESCSLLHDIGWLRPRSFPLVHGTAEPRITLEEAYGSAGVGIIAQIERAHQIVFHAVGDTGSTLDARNQLAVAAKMESDYDEHDASMVPSFFYHLGDVIYSFGEARHYYDEFYDPYRGYPAPIIVIPGNHDGMVAPFSSTPSLQAFLDNFCAYGEPPHRTPEAGELARTAQVQPGVYFTLESPFVRILGLYSNCLEDPGIISDEGGAYPHLGQVQVDFLKAALQRVREERFEGAVIIAVHHPPYVAQKPRGQSAGRHGGSPRMLQDIDSACGAAGVWPHAVFSGHAHNYQRFTRLKEGRETPFIVAGGGGHAISRLTRWPMPPLRVPALQPSLSDGSDTVIFESYDDQDFGYLRVTVNASQLRIEYHPATDGGGAKTPDDSVTVDLATRKLAHFALR